MVHIIMLGRGQKSLQKAQIHPLVLQPPDKAGEKMKHRKSSSACLEKRKKAMPVRKLLELERQQSVNDENVSSDANRPPPMTEGCVSILGSLERLVESSFSPSAELAQQVLASSKRTFDLAEDEDLEEKRPRLDPVDKSCSAAELKFLKYSELAKELSSKR